MKQTFSHRFVDYLQSMADDRAKLATLRKGLIDHQAQATWPLLAPFLNFDSATQLKTLQTVAGLFGYHTKNVTGVNFGQMCHELLDAEEKQKLSVGESGPMSRRFQYVMAADGAEILARVKNLVLRAKRDDIGLDYARLLDDLLSWPTYRRDKIKLNWGKSFWQGMSSETVGMEASDHATSG